MKQFLISVDQTINTMFLGFADETISARAFRLRNDGWATQYKWINRLFFWQKNHCEGSHIAEIRRRHLPPAYRKASSG